MLPIPADIFTEPAVAPNDLANLGPLRGLAGVWQADKGVDINPKAAGPERRVFREHMPGFRLESGRCWPASGLAGGVPGMGTGLEVEVLYGASWQQP
jgi:hypothetical protein